MEVQQQKRRCYNRSERSSVYRKERQYSPRNFSSLLLMLGILPATTFALSAVSPSVTSVSPTEHLRTLAEQSHLKVRGSVNYTKAWRHWSILASGYVRDALGPKLPCPVDHDTTCELKFQLGVAADQGEMPSFEDAGARAGYAMDFFCRAVLAADILVDPHSVAGFFAEELDGLFQRETFQTSSIGGGPGYDFVGAALVASFHNGARGRRSDAPTTSVRATVMDYEEGWADIVDAMSIATQEALSFDNSHHSCTFGGKCDITKPLHDASNAGCLSEIDSTDLWVCQYCVAENAAKLRESDFVFFSDLFRSAKDGALFLFTETTHRLWPEFVELVTSEGGGFEVAFPMAIGRSKGGHQLCLKKKEGATISDDQLVLLDKFILDRKMHELKIDSGFVRQAKKIRGAK